MIGRIFITLFFYFFVSTVHAQIAGTLDSSFNSNGIYTHDFGFQDNLNDVKVQSDKKVVCTGVALSPAFAGVLKVLRLKADGTPDSTFGTNGDYSLLLGNETYGYESVLRPDGKIIVAGLTYDANYNGNWLLLRLDSTGTLDPTFGTNGITTVDFFTRDDIAQAVTLQADGKILVSGTINDTINYYNNPTIVRFTENGIIDSTFGTNGIVTVAGIDIDNELTSIAVQNDGKIVAAGHYSKVFTGAMDFDVLVIRVDSTGALDASFGVNGVVKTSINGGIDDSFGMELDTAQNIVVAGFTTLPFTLTLDMVLLKYDNTGTLDPSFGTGGIVTFNNADEDAAYDLKIQPDNKIVVAGASGLSFFGPRSAAVWRYLPDGTPDITFGTNGFITTDINPTFQDFNAVDIAPDGKIVCAGRTNNGTQNDITVVRYFNDGLTSVNEIISGNTVSVFPNPASTEIEITGLSYGVKSEITILSAMGQKIYSTVSTTPNLKLQTSNFPTGIYFLQIKTNSSVHTIKICIKH